MPTIEKILTELGLAAAVQTVYRSLIEEGEASARTLAGRTGIARTSIYDHIKQLKELDLVVERDTSGKTIYTIQDPERLQALLSDKIDTLQQQQTTLKAELPKLLAKTESVQPKIRFFESSDGMQQMLKDILWHDHITLQIVWSYEHMLDVLGSDFLQWFNERRIRNKIAVQALWPHSAKKQTDHIFVATDAGVERRYLNKKQSPAMSYIIYQNKTIFVSSGREAFGFIVDSAEHADLMRLQFSALWNQKQ